MKIGPRFFITLSFAASKLEAELEGYSPPTPIPVNPLATVIIQMKPVKFLCKLSPDPWAPVAKMTPTTIQTVERTIPHLRPL